MLTKPSANMLNGVYDGAFNRGSLGSITRRPAFDLIVAPDTVSAREFVNCDGTDETVKLQAAFDAAKNKRLILPAGKVKHRGLVIDPLANYSVGGCGFDPNGGTGTVLENIGTAGEIGILVNTNPNGLPDSQILGRDNLRHFENFGFFGNRFCGDAFQFAYAFGFSLDKLWVSTHGGHGVWGFRAFSSSIRRTVVTHIGKHGVFFEEMGNKVQLDGVVATDCSKGGGGFSNICFSATNSAGASLGVEISGCDWTAGGSARWDGGADPQGTGLALKYVYGASIHGNYAEISPNILTYIASTCKAIDFRGNYMQDGDTKVESGAQGIIVEANHFQRVNAGTRFLGESGQSANKCRYFGNTYTGGATETVTG